MLFSRFATTTTTTATRIATTTATATRTAMLLTTQRSYCVSGMRRGFEEFSDPAVTTGNVITSGRSWTAADLRRKSFDDLHALWFVLYKERNLLLSTRDKHRRQLSPCPEEIESRYHKTKRSMGAIKLVLAERKKIDRMLLEQQQAAAGTPSAFQAVEQKKK